MKSAISKAYTVVARTFVIGADIKEREQAAYKRVEKNEGKSYVKPVKKSFDNAPQY